MLNNYLMSRNEKIVLGLDAKDGKVAVKGWVETVELTAVDLGKQMKELGIRTAVYTDVSGMDF